MSVKNTESLTLALPLEGKLIQYVGRLRHGSHPKVLINYQISTFPFWIDKLNNGNEPTRSFRRT